MALETATIISDLVITNPTAGDPKSQGDDHLRLIKSVMVNTNGLEGHGHCKLQKSGANLVLSPFKGSLLVINGKGYAVPAAGVSLAPTALTPSTLYYIYAYMSGATMTLEASVTTHATDANTGVEIKSGDATRTLVGMARPITGPAWQDTAAQRFVRSWFNDPGIAGLGTFTANRATTNTSYAELNSEIRNEFLIWTGEICNVGGSGSSTQTNGTAVNSVAVGFDGVATLEAGSYSAGYGPTNNFGLPYTINLPKSGLSEGYHYVTLAAKVTAGTGTWSGGTITGTNVDVCSLSTYIKN